MADAPVFPPLLRGEPVPRGTDPFAKAIAAATVGSDPGVIYHDTGGDGLRAAIILAPETPLSQAMPMVMVAASGFADALGALAPPEVGVHFLWPGGFRVNGARCGGLRAAASTTDAEAEPDWLVIGLAVPFRFAEGEQPGEDPDRTVLIEEGCADVEPVRLLESWSRHLLVWMNTLLDGGMAKLHADWRARAFDIGEEVSVALPSGTCTGIFVGLDEMGGMLLREGAETRLIPLTAMLEP